MTLCGAFQSTPRMLSSKSPSFNRPLERLLAISEKTYKKTATHPSLKSETKATKRFRSKSITMELNVNRAHRQPLVRYIDWKECAVRLQHHNYQFIRTMQELEAIDRQNKATTERQNHEIAQWQACLQASKREQDLLRKELLDEKSRRLDDLAMFHRVRQDLEEQLSNAKEETARELEQFPSDQTQVPLEPVNHPLRTPFNTPVLSQSRAARQN